MIILYFNMKINYPYPTSLPVVFLRAQTRFGHLKIWMFLICTSYLLPLAAQSDHILWYDKPATYFEETLALGNGKMGAAVFGGVATDSIFLNDATLWSGEPVNANNNPDAHSYIPAIRKALEEENYKLADELQHKVQGAFSQSYMPLGTLKLEFEGQDNYTNYRRELDISKAVSRITYESNGVQYQREYLVSHPDQVMIIKLSSSGKQAISGKISFNSLMKFNTTTSSDTYEINGYAPYHVEPNYRGDMPDAVLFDPERGTRFTTLLKAVHKDGRVEVSEKGIEIVGCSQVVLYIAEETSFNGYNKNPATEGKDQLRIARKNLDNALRKPLRTIEDDHRKDYTGLFSRVALSLGETHAPDLPTNERLLRYAEGKEDKKLEVLYFQYGRYLLISSSRTPGVPANLQGIWNPYMRPPWSSNYTLNINLEENYWLAETANLSEMHRPLFDFIKNLSVTGAITAKTYYGTGGWTASQNSDIWALTNPVGDFGEGDPNWANWNMGGVWLATHLWEHYAFTKDRKFLKEKAYPILQGAVRFCLDWVVKDKEGYWITSPSTSPENLFITPEGYAGATLYGASADIGMIKEITTDFLLASKLLGVQNDLTGKAAEVRDGLRPYQIGKKGNLQEWYYDWEDQEPLHRHQSHLFGLYPGHHISPSATPGLAEASAKTLDIKGDETTGWSKGWRINLWARLRDGDRAYKMYRELLKYVDPDGFKGNHGGHGGTYPNLFDAHPPFQIDGNFGGAAAVIEMLLQSDMEHIYLLPALPETWKDGKVSGICARGAFEVSMEWKNGRLIRSTITARKTGTTTLVYGNSQKNMQLRKGKSVMLTW